MNAINLLRSHFVNYYIPVRAMRKKIIQRNIVDVLTKEEYEEELKTIRKSKTKRSSAATASKDKKLVEPTPTPPGEFKKLIPKSVLKLKYKKLRDLPGNILNSFLLKMKSSSFRRHHSLCLIPSTTIVKEAVEVEYSIHNVYFNRLKKLQNLPRNFLLKVHLTHIPDRVLDSFPKNISDGVFAVAGVQDAKTRKLMLKRRRNDDIKGIAKLLPHTLVYEGIKCTTTLGEMLKIAEESGCQQVYVMEGCADVWDLQAINSGQGAHFKIPIIDGMTWEKLERLRMHHHVWVSRHNADDVSLRNFASEDETRQFNNISSVFDMLEDECSEGSRLKSDYSNSTIPCVPCDEVNLIQPSFILCGDIGTDGFLFVAKAAAQQNIHCSFINTECDEANLQGQINTILQESKRQKDKRKALKEISSASK